MPVNTSYQFRGCVFIIKFSWNVKRKYLYFKRPSMLTSVYLCILEASGAIFPCCFFHSGCWFEAHPAIKVTPPTTWCAALTAILLLLFVFLSALVTLISYQLDSFSSPSSSSVRPVLLFALCLFSAKSFFEGTMDALWISNRDRKIKEQKLAQEFL